MKTRRQEQQREGRSTTSDVFSERSGIVSDEAKNLHSPVTRTHEAQGEWIDMSAIAPISDAELLRRYEKGNNETAFRALVERYQGMVVGAAFRRTGNGELAREVAQEVFAALARKARFLTGRASIGGWLHQAAVYQAARAMQSEARPVRN
ncbi:MAG: sigma-70 family RNA polymerase sigma factor, partial [Verrucomicrobiaceae bacterium]